MFLVKVMIDGEPDEGIKCESRERAEVVVEVLTRVLTRRGHTVTSSVEEV